MKRMTWIVLLIISVSHCKEHGLTPHGLTFIDDVKNVAGFGDAQHRGPNWYDYSSKSSGESGSDLKSSLSDTSSITAGSSSFSSSQSSEASSMETNEKRQATQSYRTCTPCPHDMMKKYRNFGIKWICGGYQRARRSFKSECMMRYRNCQDGTIDLAATLIPNATNLADIKNDLKGVKTRRKSEKHRSTSSSDDARVKGSDSEEDKESLQLSTDQLSSSSSQESRDRSSRPQSTGERRGWRKWHRKCTPCPEDMAKKWRDPSIEWICGAYQRARRSFKSLCMMHYRNCQDGTMFVKIHDHKCENDTGRDQRRGIHFFYDYQVKLDEDSSETSASSDSVTDDSADW